MGLTKPDADVSMEQGNILGSFLDKMLHKGYDFVIVQSAGNSIKNESTKLYETTNALNSGLFCWITIPEVKDRIIVVGNIGSNGSHRNGLLAGLVNEYLMAFSLHEEVTMVKGLML